MNVVFNHRLKIPAGLGFGKTLENFLMFLKINGEALFKVH
jgi:hypothetical protein